MAKPISQRVVPKDAPSRAGRSGGWRWVATIGGGVIVVVAATVVLGLGLSAEGDRRGVTLVAYQGESLLGGRRVDLADVVGQGRPVVLNFFAGLCPPCRAEMPGFEAAWQRHRDEVIVLGVDIGPFLALGSHDDAKRLLVDLGITYPAAYVEENVIGRFNVFAMPTTIFYAADGREVGRQSGILSEAQLENAIRQLVSLSGASG